MKKMILMVMIACFTLSLVACSNEEVLPDATVTETTQENVNIDFTEVEPTTVAETTEISDELAVDEKVVIMDAALYRGSVIKIEETEEGSLITLEQADGTDFGSDTMTFLVDDATTGLTDAVEGDYVEYFYGRSMDGDFDYSNTQNAIGMNHLGNAEMVNFNGTVASIQKTDTPDGSTVESITMIDSLNDQEVVFNIHDETQLYLTIEDVNEGDALNIYHKGIYTRSMPPQGIPLEIRMVSSESTNE